MNTPARTTERPSAPSAGPAPRPGAPASKPPRIGLVDVLRGIAIIAVIGYHLMWDLGDLDLIGVHIGIEPWGMWVARSIAGTFLFLVGVSLALAHADGIRHRSFWRREAELVGYALLVTVATAIVLPHAWVSFGILHCIAVVSVLALPLVRAPWWVGASAAVAAVAAPIFITLPGQSRWIAWTGLTEGVPSTIDHAPVLPMFALTVAGVLLVRWARRAKILDRLAQVRTDRQPLSWLAFLGRHTLGIYLLHQPILLAVLYAWLALT
ncbi:heparan-alpha-glucosaminide N-acetyltransferase [Dermacoccaceae bacterium W4C1]